MVSRRRSRGRRGAKASACAATPPVGADQSSRGGGDAPVEEVSTAPATAVEGFCYLLWVADAVAVTGRQDLGYRYATEFGAYPCMSAVLLRLAADMGCDMMLCDVYQVRPGLYHVRVGTHARLSDLLNRFMFSAARVGARRPPPSGGWRGPRSRMGIAPSVKEGRADYTEEDENAARRRMDEVTMFGEMVKMAGFNVNQVVGDYSRRMLETRRYDDNDPLVQSLCKGVSGRLGLDRSREFKITDVLSAAELSMLGSAFPEFKLLPLGTNRHPHACAKVARKLAYRLVMESFAVYRSGRFEMPGTVIDVGGNVLELISGRFSGIHVCTPTMDLRDCVRRQTEEAQLRKAYEAGTIDAAMYEKLQSGVTSTLRCNQRSELCRVPAKHAALIHSQYDMDYDVIGKILDAHGIEKLISVVLFDVDIVTRERSAGVIEEVGANWVIRKDDRDGEEWIHFYFSGDSALGYRHRLNSYLSIVLSTVIMTPAGKIYVVEKDNLRAGSLHITMTLCRMRPESLTCTMDYAFWSRFGDRMVIYGYKYVDEFFMESSRVMLRPHHVVFPKEYYEKVMKHMIRAREKAFSWHDILSVAVTFSQRMTINGMDITQPESIIAEDIFWGVVNLYVYSYRLRNNGGKLVKYLTDQTKVMRDSNDISLCELLYYGTGANRIFGKMTLIDSIKRHCSENRKKTEHFEVLINSSVNVVRFEDYVRVRAESFRDQREFTFGLHDVDVDFSAGNDVVAAIVKGAMERNAVSRREEEKRANVASSPAMSLPRSPNDPVAPDVSGRSVGRPSSRPITLDSFGSGSSQQSGTSDVQLKVSDKRKWNGLLPRALEAVSRRPTVGLQLAKVRKSFGMCTVNMVENAGGGNCCYYALRDAFGFPDGLSAPDMRALIGVFADSGAYTEAGVEPSDFDCLSFAASDVQGNLSVVRLMCKVAGRGLCMHMSFNGNSMVMGGLVEDSGDPVHISYVTVDGGKNGHYMGEKASLNVSAFSRFLMDCVGLLISKRGTREAIDCADRYLRVGEIMPRHEFEFISMLGELSLPIVGPVLEIGPMGVDYSGVFDALGVQRYCRVDYDEFALAVGERRVDKCCLCVVEIDAVLNADLARLRAVFDSVAEVLAVGGILIVKFPNFVCPSIRLLRCFSSRIVMQSPAAVPMDPAVYFIGAAYDRYGESQEDVLWEPMSYARNLANVVRSLSSPTGSVCADEKELRVIADNLLGSLKTRVGMTGAGWITKDDGGVPYIKLATGGDSDDDISVCTMESIISDLSVVPKKRSRVPAIPTPGGPLRSLGSRGSASAKSDASTVVGDPDEHDKLYGPGTGGEIYGPKVNCVDKFLKRTYDFMSTAVLSGILTDFDYDYIRRDFKPDSKTGTCEVRRGCELVIDRRTVHATKQMAEVASTRVTFKHSVVRKIFGKCQRKVLTHDASTQFGGAFDGAEVRILGSEGVRENRVLVACKEIETQTEFLMASVERDAGVYDFFHSSSGTRCEFSDRRLGSSQRGVDCATSTEVSVECVDDCSSETTDEGRVSGSVGSLFGAVRGIADRFDESVNVMGALLNGLSSNAPGKKESGGECESLVDDLGSSVGYSSVASCDTDLMNDRHSLSTDGTVSIAHQLPAKTVPGFFRKIFRRKTDRETKRREAVSDGNVDLVDVEVVGSSLVSFSECLARFVPRITRVDDSARLLHFRNVSECLKWRRKLLERGRRRLFVCFLDDRGKCVPGTVTSTLGFAWAPRYVCDLGFSVSDNAYGMCVYLRESFLKDDMIMLVKALDDVCESMPDGYLCPVVIDYARNLKCDLVTWFLIDKLYVCVSEIAQVAGEAGTWVDLLNTYRSVEKRNVGERKRERVRRAEEAVVAFPALAPANRPVYFPGDKMVDFFRNSMIEYLEYLKVGDATLASGVNVDWKVLSVNPQCADARYRDYTVFSNVLRKMVRRGPVHIRDSTDAECGETDRLFGFDGRACVPYDGAKGVFDTDVDIVVTSKDVKLNITADKISRLERINIAAAGVPKVRWINGVPGCGKTRFIVEQYKEGDLVLTATRAGREEVYGRLESEKAVTDRKCVRTIDSYLMHGEKGVRRHRVFVDEALMYHGGALAFVCTMSGASECVLVGDRQQIPFIDRLGVFPLLYEDASSFAVENTVLNVSYRCPVDVGYLLRQQGIHGGMVCTSGVMKSMTCGIFSDYAALCDAAKGKAGVLFLCMTQCEKLDMKAAQCGKYGEIMTVHESQGLTREHVIMVRTNSKEVPIFTSVPHIVVAVSRHTKSFQYYGKGGDLLFKWISGVVAVDQQSMASVNQKGLRDALMSGGNCRGGQLLPDDAIFDLMPGETVRPNIVASISHMPHVSHAVYAPRFVGERWVDDRPTDLVSVLHGCDVDVLQTWYDEVFPGAAENDYKDDQLVVESSELNILVDGKVRMDLGKNLDAVRSKWSKLVPSIRTMMPANRIASQRESLLALVKRNLNVPCVKDPRLSRSHVAVSLFDNFVLSAIDPDKLCARRQFRDNRVGVNAVEVQRWLDQQKPVVEKTMDSDESFEDREYYVFEFMIKNQLKPPLELAAAWKYASLQTIAFQKKFINAMFCPIMKVMRERLLMVLRRKFVMYTDMSPNEFEVILNERVNPSEFKYGHHVENDMGKYDKSQDESALDFECMMYDFLGMDQVLIKIWYAAHMRSRLIDRANGMSVFVNWQRRSGDASTFFGNTLFAMAVTLALYDWRSITCGVFAGDDSWLLGRNPAIKVDRSGYFSAYFNLESKLLSYKNPMFCSKFMVCVDDWITVVPDPVKVVTKFGRLDMANWEHVEDYRRSCEDYLRSFGNETVYPALSAALTERYNTVITDHSVVFSLIAQLVSDKEKFRQLFNEPEGPICLDPSRARLE